MSGMARAWPTMPGRCATLATCTSAGSSRTSSISFSLAYTRAGTRIPPWRGISHTYSPTRVSRSGATASDIEDHARPPATVGLPDRQLMVGDTLDLRMDLVPGGVNRLTPQGAAGNPVVHRFDLELAGEESVRSECHEERLEPVVQELLQALGVDAERSAFARPDPREVGDQPEHGEPRPLEEEREAGCLDLEPAVGGVLDLSREGADVSGPGHHDRPQWAGSAARRLSCSIWMVTCSIWNSRAQSSAMAARIASSRVEPFTTACAERAHRPVVRLHTWRSWTSSVPGTRSSARRSVSTSMWAGTASMSTSTASRTSVQEPKTMRATISRLASASADCQPPTTIARPATTAPIEPSRSESTWR